jgi:hypothetical protein
MNPFPHDVFTEPSDVDPDTLANLGPLTRLAGRWEASKGVDINPKADAPERRTFVERVAFDAIDPQANGPQLFYGLRYHTHITTREEEITFHEQVGYWLYEPATGLILQTLAIPRGQVALAAGHAKPGDDRLTLTATRGETEYGICSTTFLEYGFRTDSYQIDITFHGDDAWSYDLKTMLLVHGRPDPFDHHDQNTLHRTAPGKPNALKQILDRRATKASILPVHGEVAAPEG